MVTEYCIGVDSLMCGNMRCVLMIGDVGTFYFKDGSPIFTYIHKKTLSLCTYNIT